MNPSMDAASGRSGPESASGSLAVGSGGEVSLTVGAVARRLGVAPATLRTWDRRYGLGPSAHATGAHRRYGPGDIARLEHMRRLILAGVAPAEAARSAKDLVVEAGAVDITTPPRPTHLSSVGGDAQAVVDASVEGAGGRHGGGHVVAVPGGSPAARGLARAAVSLDSRACEAIVGETLESRGIVWTWDHLLVPVLIGVGQRWEQTGSGIEVEHVLSEAVQSVLSARALEPFTPINARPVLLAATDGELHTLPLFAIAAGLRERLIGTRMLGARTPASALEAAVRRTGPAAVLMWSQMPDTGSLDFLDTFPDVRPEPVIVLAGPGWHPGSTRARRVHDLTGSIEAIARAVGA